MQEPGHHLKNLGWGGLGVAVVLASVLAAQPAFTIPVSSGNFTHKAHIDKGMSECSSCHGDSGDGKVQSPGANHEPCNTCHAEEFRKKDSQLCFGCHDSNNPWTKDNPVKSLSGGASDFQAGFSHKAHKDRIDTFKKGDCATCHPTQSGKEGRAGSPSLGGGKAFLPQAHADCSTCHKQIAPKMNDCAGCHILSAKAADKGTDPKWSVADKFTHKSHLDRGQTCENCHQDVLAVEAGKAIPRPTMKSCGSCHNGKTAFKSTGHECTKCHGPARR